MILSQLGCVYHGVDIAPSALEKARNSLLDYPTATLEKLNVVTGKVSGMYDAALDVMGFHMLVTDPDRMAYLKNAWSCLKNNAPMFFFREMCDENMHSGFIDTFEQWLAVSNHDYTTPRQLNYKIDGKEVEIQIPCVPGRSVNKASYTRELAEAGFIVDSIIEMPPSYKCGESVSIYVHKP
ncbi:MAG: class I SAM-dependent methyltransferase [Defluviitaleaceae bacterium]|nr:class I SAM-dependent methyltransferase [Defluviitaleaceae bacterium]